MSYPLPLSRILCHVMVTCSVSLHTMNYAENHSQNFFLEAGDQWFSSFHFM